MNITLNLKKGLDLSVAGAIAGQEPKDAINVAARSVALTPDDFPGLTLKPSVKEGDCVSAGSPLMHDKRDESILIVSPIAGKVSAIVRGERRKLERIVIEPSKAEDNITFDTSDAGNAAGAAALLKASGLWAMLRQRPYNIVASTDARPRDIMVTTLDTAPLAPDYDSVLAQRGDDLATGVRLLALLTDGSVYVARRAGSSIADIAGTTMVDVNGPHPAGNAGVLIANVKPVNKGETVWTLDGMTLARIGRLARTGQLDTQTTVALTGSEVATPCYINVPIGADMASITDGRLAADNAHKRIISGNMLTGTVTGADGYLRYPYTQVTVIPEGDDVTEFMGWASISPSKMSTSRSFPGHFLHRLFKPDARILGGRRAMIMSGEYDRVLPMDIMTEYLIKAILSRDIEKMEALGIYEIAPEDVALAEYVCTSKMPLQSIVAQGLEYLRKELE